MVWAPLSNLGRMPTPPYRAGRGTDWLANLQTMREVNMRFQAKKEPSSETLLNNTEKRPCGSYGYYHCIEKPVCFSALPFSCLVERVGLWTSFRALRRSD